MDFYAPVDRRALEIRDRSFDEPVNVYAQPTYGRFLFTRHDVLVDSCEFGGRLALHGPLRGAVISRNYFSDAR